MNAPRPVFATRSRPAAPISSATQWTARKDRRPSVTQRRIAFTRRYQLTWIDDEGRIEDATRVAPAMPAFEAGFSAFTHGALIATTEGPVAVEDLVPGMMIETVDAGPRMLRWIGSITLIPGGPDRGGRPDKLYRVPADGLGLGRPTSDVTFGPAARILDRSPETCAQFGTDAAFSHISEQADGMSVIEITPVAPVQVYHLGFDRHHVITASGVEVESYHPGADIDYSLSDELRAEFMALFPHKAGLHDFGRMLWPRFEPQQID